MTASRPGRGKVAAAPSAALAWSLFAAFFVHNIEEVATMERFLRGDPGGLNLLQLVGPGLLAPFLVAVTVVTVVALVLVVAATTGPPRTWATGGLRILAVVMVVNVVVPHVPAAFAVGGYVPGLVTAVLVNLPVALVFLTRTAPRRSPGV